MASRSIDQSGILEADGTLPADFVVADNLANLSVTARTIDPSVTTDEITEGIANLYYTDNRARLAITVTGGGYYDNANGIITVGGPGLNTTNIVEGANLFFTNARARAAISNIDSTIEYNPITGTIRANVIALGFGENVVTVQGQTGVVTLTTTDLPEGANLYFTNTRAQVAIRAGLGISINNGQVNVDPTANLVLNELATSKLTVYDPGNAVSNIELVYDQISKSLVINSNITPLTSELHNLGAVSETFNELYVKQIYANNITLANTITAEEFIGNVTGDLTKFILVSADNNSLLIDQSSNPDLFLPKGTKVRLDLGSDTLIGIGFDIGQYDASNNDISNGANLNGLTYLVNNQIVTGFTNWAASFNDSNTRTIVYSIPQSAPFNLIYYSLQFTEWRGNITVAPPTDTDDLREGSLNFYYSDQRVDDRLFTVADGNVGLLFDQEASILTLAQDISIDAGVNFDNVTANAFYGNAFYGTLYGNIIGQLTDLNGLTTTELPEGSNAYFTVSRVRTNVNAINGISYSSITGIFELEATNVIANFGNANIVYGSPNTTITIEVDEWGRLENVNNLPIVISSNAVLEGSNLFFTNARVVANVANLSINVLADVNTTGAGVGQALVWDGNTWIPQTTISGNVTGAANIANLVISLGNHTTSNLAEGTNLYFTDERVQANVANLSVNVLIDVDTTGAVVGQALVWDGTNWVPQTVDAGSANTATLANTALFANVANLANLVASLENHTTSNLVEGANLYFTDDRVWTNVSANIGFLWSNIYSIAGGGSLTTSNVAEGANLYYTDERVWANVGANIGFLWSNIESITAGTGLTTSAVAEGANLYFTNARVFAALQNSTSNVSNISLNRLVVYNSLDFITTGAGDYANIEITNTGGTARMRFNVGDNNVDGVDFSVVDANNGVQINNYQVWHAGNDGTGSGLDADLLDGQQGSYYVSNTYLANITTTQVVEGTGLYFTNARSRASIGTANSTSLIYYESNGNFQINVESVGAVTSVNGQVGAITLTTTDVAEGANLYFTNARVYANVINLGYATTGYVDGAVANLVNSAPASLDTLFELAAALGNDASFATTVLNLIGTKANTVSLTTANVIEVGNLYFTNTRARAAVGTADQTIIYYESNGNFQANISAIGAGVTSVNGQTGIVTLTTANIAEGTNLYYTDERVWANVGANIGNVNSWLVATNSNVGNLNSWTSSNSANIGNLNSWIRTLTTTGVAEGANLYFTNDRVWSNVGANIGSLWNTLSTITGGTTLSTSNVAEGANLYFTNARARAAISGGTGVIYNQGTGQLSIGQAVETSNSVTFANVTVTNYVNLGINGLRFPADAFGGSGDSATITLTAATGEATRMTFTMTNDADDMFNFVAPSNDGLLMNGNKVWHAGNDGAGSGLDADLLDGFNSSHFTNTSNITEGTNLYFSNTRARAAVGSANTETLVYYEANGRFQVNVETIGTVTSVNGQTGVVSLTTTQIAEGANLYFSNDRTRAAITGGTGVTYIESNGQINIGQAVGTSSDVEFRNIVITGNLFVQGTETTINATELAISDNMIYLNEAIQEALANAVGDGANVVYTTVQTHGFPLGSVVRVTGITPANLNQLSYTTILAVTSNTFTIAKTNTDVYVSGGNAFGKSSINPDLGWSGGYNDGTYHHAGMFRDATDGIFKIFNNYQPEPDANIFIDTGHASFRLANIMASEFIGPVIGNVSSLANHTTSNLTEGTNQYFTQARARQSISVTGGGSYNSSTGVISIDTLASDNVIHTEETFTGNGIANVFTLTSNATRTDSIVVIDGLIQFYTADYTISGNTSLIFTSPPADGETIKVLRLQTASTGGTSSSQVEDWGTIDDAVAFAEDYGSIE